MKNNNHNNLNEEVIAESDNFFIWRNREEGEYLYHIELGGLTLHLFSEEWEEFLMLVKSVH